MKFQYKKFRTIDGKIIYKPVIPEVRFSYEITPFGFGVLGQLGFFDKFIVKFDYQKKSVEIVPKRTMKNRHG